MASITPDGWRTLEATGAAARQVETLLRLEAGLPDDYAVYHAVHWSTVEQGHSIYGEISFAIVNRAGEVLLIEQLSGLLDETPNGLVKRRPGFRLSVSVGISRSLQALERKLSSRGLPEPVSLEYLLYCPDYLVREPATAGLAPERIVDAGLRERLVERIRAVLGPGEPRPVAPEVHRFLRDIIQLEADVSALVGRARALVNRISGGLTHWARQLEMSPYRLRVTGTAGSGKTQLALSEYRAALAAGRRILYVCYNRPLADHFRAIAPTGGEICTFHMLCDRFVRTHGGAPDFSRPDAFEALVDQAAQLEPSEDFRFDGVIVDEGQDFSEAWRDQVFRLARPDARLLWLEDPLQNLYGRAPVALPGWVGLRAQGNYRSPRGIVRLLARMLPEGWPIESHAPFDTGEVEFLVYDSAEALEVRVREALRLCFAAGFGRQDTALVTFRGREHSVLLQRDSLGRIALRRFTGRYDLFGAPEYSAGEVLAESVYRFKGQAAPAIVLAEVDFEAFDERAMRKFFVGATRAMMKLVVVLSSRAHRILRQSGRIASMGDLP